MNKYHYDALLRRIDSSPLHFDALKSIMRVPYHNLLITTGLCRQYHPLPRTLYEPQDVLEGYWTVTLTLQSTAWLQITIRPALRDDPPPHAWHDLDNYHQIQAGVTLRISRRNALRDMRYLLELVFPLYLYDVGHGQRRTTPLSPVREEEDDESDGSELECSVHDVS
ncbi:uncharacterized protein FSUBG_5973 [Fusarium subglutinans]|uniref:Uncharacterized protein n=1 Tax=Gibberella subglutinans TaxID=42677 RepID=A0A8H5V357_GIBSU|nr:uncharacterized protein FSUBG_5973 [Fusarium subglutinans]KAF5606574.1 hypothetical protein FSUBG_5973 [Fusarium subglutinans]